MAIQFPFEYAEVLPPSTLARAPANLAISGIDNPPLLLITRLLSGSIKFKHVKTSRVIIQKENYFSTGFRGYAQYWDRKFPLLIAEDYSSQQFSEYIAAGRNRNRIFYRNILSELSYFFYYQSKGASSSAFVFLYRLLEHVSYAFPLIYVSKTDDFTKTFVSLKKLMSGDNSKSELGFLKIFVTTVFKDDPIFESSIDFNMSLNTETEQQEVYDLLKGLCLDNMLADATDEPRMLAIKYPEVGAFLISVRNRFFHFMNGDTRNISSSRVADIDVVFSLINKKCLYWISTILLAVIAQTASDFEDTKARIALQGNG